MKRPCLLGICLALWFVNASDAQPASDLNERVLLLLPHAPLLVEFQLTIDEQPFRAGADRTAFAVQGQAFLGARLDGSQLEQVLDVDRDGRFSDDEMAAASQRIRSRDADDNEIVSVREIAGVTQPGNINGVRAMAATESILPLNADTKPEQLHATLVERYGVKGILSPGVFKYSRECGKQLDTDGDQSLTAEETFQLRTIDAPLVLNVALGTRTKLRDTVVITSLAEELKRIARIDRGADGKLLLDLITVRIEVLAPNPKPTPRTFAGQATAYVSNFDKDKNGYLDRGELAGSMVAAQFDAWDADRNGQVYADEIRTALEAADLPNWQKISVAALSEGSSVFTQLDENADGQLGVREIQNAPQRLRDVTLQQDEMLRIAIARGNETYKYLSKGTKLKRPPRASSTANATEGPEWFIHMDTNGDGDITAREFLGSAEQFDRLDANDDGILEAGEAK